MKNSEAKEQLEELDLTGGLGKDATPLEERKDAQLYYVKFVRNLSTGYLNLDIGHDKFFIDSKREEKFTRTKFTKQEIMAINPNYMLFAVPVEEIDNDK